MRLTNLERETIINFNASESMATLYTANPVIYRRMVKRGYKPERLDDESWEFTFPRQKVYLPRKVVGTSRKGSLWLKRAF